MVYIDDGAPQQSSQDVNLSSPYLMPRFWTTPHNNMQMYIVLTIQLDLLYRDWIEIILCMNLY